MSGRHRPVAEDCWKLIKALGEGDDVDAAAVKLIEMACDSAVLAVEMGLVGGTKITWDKDGNRIVTWRRQ